jgi:hypothetical protein
VNTARKAAILAYKQRKTPRGIFAVRCAATGNVWVDSAMDLDAAENRTWFALRHRDPQIEKLVAAEFAAHGRDAFAFEVVEKLDEDVPSMSLRETLKERKALWAGRLGARTLWPI